MELIAEVVLHALYSASLTSAQYAAVGQCMDTLCRLGQESPFPLPFHAGINFNSNITMEWWYPEEVGMKLARMNAASHSKAQSEADRRR
ncbi:hypothetical protein FRC01_004728, partial [Tulasnella sp. 417]